MDKGIIGLATFLSAIGCFLLWRMYLTRCTKSGSDVRKTSEKAAVEVPYHAIEPLRSFDWKATEPIQVRVFKPKFYLTMGEYILQVVSR